MEKEIRVGLIKNRHAMPVSEYIFDCVENVHDYKAISEHIGEFLVNRVGITRKYGCGLNQDDYTDVKCFSGKADLVVYVTGLTPVVAELVSACLFNGVHLTLMNYDTDSESYIPQKIY